MTNTLSLPRSGKLAVLASALVYTGLSFGFATGAAPVEAAGAPYYTAKLTAPASDLRAVADGVAWACKGETCVANKTSARPLRVCRGLGCHGVAQGALALEAPHHLGGHELHVGHARFGAVRRAAQLHLFELGIMHPFLHLIVGLLNAPEM